MQIGEVDEESLQCATTISEEKVASKTNYGFKFVHLYRKLIIGKVSNVGSTKFF